ncbi:LysM peptidoglycan-binding domain-containing protein [Salinarimonas sp. NSM]|uniref:LysM peptidoglycan-binding domain-containing protein n=1 Tax=Salinarimonas sp. NSM TaxID=3458003 RepID=UPI00403690E2
MPVERRRIIAIIVTLLLAAGGIGAFLVNESRVGQRAEDGAATAVEAMTPERAEVAAPVVADVRPTVAPTPETLDEAPVEAAQAQPPVGEPLVAEPVAAETVAAETVVPDPSVPAAPVPATAQDVAGSAEPAATPDVVVAAVEPAAPAEAVVAQPEPEAPAPAPTVARADDAEAVFDLVRVEPTGDAVIAGRARAGATVELLRNGERHDIIVADATGAFAFVPPPLPPGTHEIALQIQEADGTARRGRQSVTVVVADTMDTAPIVALAEPGAPTRVLSQPEPPASSPMPSDETVSAAQADGAEEEVGAEAAREAAEPAVQVAGADAGASPTPGRAGVRIASVEAESGGGLYVSGEAGPEAGVRLYLNDTFVGAAAADGAGAVSFAIGTGVRPGVYRVRLDEIGGADGRVLSRAEVSFEMPALPEAPAVAAAPEADPAAVPPASEPVVVADASADAGEPAASASRIVAEPVPPAAPAQEAAPAAATVTTTTPPISAEGTGEARTATLTIPAVNTALVVRGDSLWRISRRIYGDGIRYTVIFDANQDQIRNPDLIFPGQVFVLPAQEPAAAPAAADARGG